jgi:hypothetical protein
MNPFRILRQWRDSSELAGRTHDRDLDETLRQAAADALARTNAIRVSHAIVKDAFGLSDRIGVKRTAFDLIGVIQDAAALRPKPLITSYKEHHFDPSSRPGGEVGGPSGGGSYILEMTARIQYNLTTVRGDSVDLRRANAAFTFSYYEQTPSVDRGDLRRFPRYVRRAARRHLITKFPNLQFIALVHDGFREVPTGEPDRAGYRRTIPAIGRIRLCVLGELVAGGSSIAVRRVVRNGEQLALTPANIDAVLDEAAAVCGGRRPAHPAHPSRTWWSNRTWGNG